MTYRQMVIDAANASGKNVCTDDGSYDDLKWWTPAQEILALRKEIADLRAQKPVGIVDVYSDLDGTHNSTTVFKFFDKATLLYAHAPDSAARINELGSEVDSLKQGYTKEFDNSVLKEKEIFTLTEKLNVSHDALLLTVGALAVTHNGGAMFALTPYELDRCKQALVTIEKE